MTYTLATAAHEAALRRLAREQAMPGWVRLAFACEPDWVAGHAVLGHLAQTVVALDDAGAVVGCGVRAVRKVYVNGQIADVGYLCGLRSLPRARRSLGLAHAYRFLRRIHEGDRRAPVYLSTIIESNRAAQALLASGRASLPAYLDHGRFITSAIPLGRRRAAALSPGGVDIRTGGDVPLAAILDFLRDEGPKHQFFPVLERADFGNPHWRDLDPRGFRVALSKGIIIGVTAVWDQSAFRQTVVAGYAPALRVARPLLNAASRIAGRRPLPSPGQRLNYFHAAFTCIRNNDPAIFRALLEHLHAEFRRSPYEYFVIGLHERDPLRAALRDFSSWDYVSRLYLVCWEDGRPFCDALRPDLIPHLETATL
ncbi:MAG: hypothetical protein FJ222_09695 [Lentisphaerae bacterium]|nr:hypothetical protein [Lentisphaerota bacterium]